MEVISNLLDYNISIPDELQELINNKSFCFIDIETTGFSRFKDKVILVGLLFPTYNGTKILQIFCDNLDEEKELLIKLIGFLSKFDILISYNGDTFDIPFLNKRFKYNNIDYCITKDNNIDLLKYVKTHKNLIELDNCKLKTVEKKLGIHREDNITGKESVELYYQYLDTRKSNIKRIILGHNYDDIYYLPSILKVYDLVNEISKIYINMYKSDKKITFELDINKIIIDNNKLIIKGKTNILDINSQIYYGDKYTFKWNPNKGYFEINIYLDSGKLSTGKSCLYINQEQFDINIFINDLSIYKLPINLLLIAENNHIIHKNIQPLVNSILQNIFKDLYF